jgi:3-methylcrotonyl-CoA carboxylase alpha subunit
VEFIVEQTAYDRPESMQFFFMEMNTRLQVEHPVTEAITGVRSGLEWQLRVGLVELLPLRQDQLHISGHAMEARICAEDPETLSSCHRPLGGVPDAGLQRFHARPGAHGQWCAARATASARFMTPCSAKLIVHGRSRDEALARMDAALARVQIAGLATNVQFLRRCRSTSAVRRRRARYGVDYPGDRAALWTGCHGRRSGRWRARWRSSCAMSAH